MKKLIFLLLFDLALKSFATTYYVANSGLDSNNGTSAATPWQTLSKVSSFTFSPGDNILFNKGDKWKGSTLYIQHNGTSASPITWGAYGTGANPLFSGFITASGWVNTGNGIWTYTNTSLPTTINVLTINGAPQAYGRYPKTGYNTYTASSGTTSITDAALSSSLSFVGGEVVIRKNHWLLTRGVIASQSSGTITYSASGSYQQNPTNGFGYFIQNHINCLTAFGDWCYDGMNHKISMYFGTALPSAYTIKISNTDALISFTSAISYNIFSNLCFEGGNSFAFNGNYGSTNDQINNCIFNGIGVSAIYFPGASNQLFSNNQLNDCMNNAIIVFGTGNSIIENSINRTAIIPGMSQSNDGIYGSGSSTAIMAGYPEGSSNTTITNNQIINTGYIGINVSGDNLFIDRNYVDTFCSVIDDGGGIYTYTGTSPIIYTKRTISNNIVLNGVGAPIGASGKNQANGIYADDNSSQLIITNNTVANCAQHGYFLHNNHDIIFTNNLGYNNSNAQLTIGHDDLTNSLPRNISISGNNLIANSGSQLCVFFYSMANNSTPSDFTAFGSSNNNYYSSLFSNINLFSTELINNSNITRNLDSWQTFVMQDKNSFVFNPTYLSVKFEYNITKTDKNIVLSGIYRNIIKDDPICTLTLSPFTSALLLLQKTSITAFDKAVIVGQ